MSVYLTVCCRAIRGIGELMREHREATLASQRQQVHGRPRSHRVLFVGELEPTGTGGASCRSCRRSKGVRKNPAEAPSRKGQRIQCSRIVKMPYAIRAVKAHEV